MQGWMGSVFFHLPFKIVVLMSSSISELSSELILSAASSRSEISNSELLK